MKAQKERRSRALLLL